VEWHDARARDGEQTGAGFTARWHLERLVALRPDDWLLRARRGATFTDEGRWYEAEEAYREAQARDAGDGLLEWYRHRAWVCAARKQWEAARRYLDRLAEAGPE
jgi:Flp pilus assembly protein TadD